jgi:hypothetical protein
MPSNGAVAVGQQLGGSCLLLFYWLHVPTADSECAFMLEKYVEVYNISYFSSVFPFFFNVFYSSYFYFSLLTSTCCNLDRPKT